MISAAAQRLDMQFWKDTHESQGSDTERAEAVFNSIYRHMRYLCAEPVPLVLCDDNITDIKKENIVKAVLILPQIYEPMKLKMREHLQDCQVQDTTESFTLCKASVVGGTGPRCQFS